MESFAGLMRQISGSYYTYFDEALLNSQQNAIIMRNDAFMEELIRHRVTPVTNLPPRVVVDDPDHPHQKSIGECIENIYKNIPRLKYILMTLLDAVFWGKGVVQLQYGRRRVMGNSWNSVVGSMPIHSDKMRYLEDGTPGIAMRMGAQDQDYRVNAFLDAYADCILPTMLGPALFLKRPFLRDRFVIHSFNPADSDYIYGLEREMGIYGLGLRSRLYWFWNLRMELLSWMLNALQRVGANGMIFGFYEEGNNQMKQDVLAAIRQLCTDNYAAFPVRGGQSGPQSAKGVIDRIEPAAVGYEILMQIIEWCEATMRRAFLGQDLSSVAKPTGIGAGAAQLQGDVRQDFIEYDSNLLADTLNEQLIPVLLKNNRFIYEDEVLWGDELPFSLRLELQLDRENAMDKMQAAQVAFQMGVDLDEDDIRKKAGLAPPKSDKTRVRNPQHQQAQQQAQAAPHMHAGAKRVDKFTRQIEKAAQEGAARRTMRRRRHRSGYTGHKPEHNGHVDRYERHGAGPPGFAPPAGHHRSKEFVR
jgi:hypothetical protein